MLKIFLINLLIFFITDSSGQVRIRLFSDQSPDLAVFSVSEGKYEVKTFNGEILNLLKGEALVIARYNGKLAVKAGNNNSFICDSVKLEGKTGNDFFYLQLPGDRSVRQYYSGDLQCFPDLETLLLINICDIELYIAGVVRAEGGPGKNIEYYKSQAVIARTYMYKYFDKHLRDGYNVCDKTHCQAFHGLSDDSVLDTAVSETRDMVILTQDSALIISAFHSNCGGETSSSENVWLTDQPYLVKVIDPYCLTSRNARWEESISLTDWIDYIKRSGYTSISDDPDTFIFEQKSRLVNYETGSITIPLRTIRLEKNLRSTFFSVVLDGDSLKLTGRGYGHGVGLCQEGAMEMAVRGFNYKQIVEFYYTGVIIANIKNAVIRND